MKFSACLLSFRYSGVLFWNVGLMNYLLSGVFAATGVYYYYSMPVCALSSIFRK